MSRSAVNYKYINKYGTEQRTWSSPAQQFILCHMCECVCVCLCACDSPCVASSGTTAGAIARVVILFG